MQRDTKGKARSSYAVSAIPQGDGAETTSLTGSEEEKTVLATRDGKEFMKEFPEASAETPKSPVEPATVLQQPVDKPK